MARGVSTANNFFSLRELKDIYVSLGGFSFSRNQGLLKSHNNSTLNDDSKDITFKSNSPVSNAPTQLNLFVVLPHQY